VHERYRRQTTDRQTDGRTTTYSEHKHEFTFAKNAIKLCGIRLLPVYFTMLWSHRLGFHWGLHSCSLVIKFRLLRNTQAQIISFQILRSVLFYNRVISLCFLVMSPDLLNQIEIHLSNEIGQVVQYLQRV